MQCIMLVDRIINIIAKRCHDNIIDHIQDS